MIDNCFCKRFAEYLDTPGFRDGFHGTTHLTFGSFYFSNYLLEKREITTNCAK